MSGIFSRQSVRVYRDQEVEPDKVELLLKAAMQAPSAGNEQPWEFIVVRNKDLLARLSRVSPYASCVKNAPVAIVVLANQQRLQYPENWQMDLSAATENILLQAVELSLGGVWLGVAPLEERMEYVSDIFFLPEHILPFAVVALGYPATEVHVADRYHEEWVYYDGYGK